MIIPYKLWVRQIVSDYGWPAHENIRIWGDQSLCYHDNAFWCGSLFTRTWCSTRKCWFFTNNDRWIIYCSVLCTKKCQKHWWVCWKHIHFFNKQIFLQVDLLFHCYFMNSIKNVTWGSSSDGRENHIVQDTLIPKDWKQLMRN